MPSDAHELAARLRRKALNVNPKWVELERAAAAELERLADENAQLREDHDKWCRAHGNALREIVRLKDAIRDIDAHATPLASDEDGFVAAGYAVSVGAMHRALGLVVSLTSAGPPQEVCVACDVGDFGTHEQHVADPAPERRCTCPTTHFLSGLPLHGNPDPACPEHGR